MQFLRWVGRLGLLGLAALLCQGSGRTQDAGKGEVAIKVVSYDGLAAEVRRHRGKVVVVDFWTELCIPCKKALPHLVELYNAHHKDGLEAITVALDPAWTPPLDPALPARLQKFLQAQNATFTHLILNDSAEVVKNKLRIESVPSLYVFSRDGRWTQFTGDNLKKDDNTGQYHEVEALVRKLLAQK